jgi:hypothetical protein
MYNPNLKLLDGLSVHTAAGQLDSLQGARDNPVTRQSFRPTYTTHPRHPVQWPYPEDVNPTHRAFLLAKAYSQFYPVEG